MPTPERATNPLNFYSNFLTIEKYIGIMNKRQEKKTRLGIF